MLRLLFTVLLLTGVLNVNGQTAEVYGLVTDHRNRPLFGVNVAIVGEGGGTITDENGRYSLRIPANRDVTLAFSYVGFNLQQIILRLKDNERRELNRQMEPGTQTLPPVEVTDTRAREAGLTRINPKTIEQLPAVSGGFEAVLKTLPGVVSNNELSTQYSVRGGNFDENLVYVNDFEIYRPFLVRSGQQEGLSFVNSDMVSSVLFSSGGFESVYGDKMSSVLDVKYRKPKKTAGSANASLLGGAVQLEGALQNNKLTYLAGIRYKSNQYLLRTLETKGEYKPSFLDLQANIHYSFPSKTEINFLGHFSQNRYRFVPVTRQTDFGTINKALRLTVYFDGQEINNYETGMTGLSVTHQVTDSLKLKFLTSFYYSNETESFDILGQYFLDELERDPGSDAFGESAFTLGVGSFLNHARNNLRALVYNAGWRSWLQHRNQSWQFGFTFQTESFNDKLSEWKYVDSAGYSLPHPRDNPGQPGPYQQQIILQDVLKTKINLHSWRLNSFIQYERSLGKKQQFAWNAGWRVHYHWLSRQWVNGPRMMLSWKPPAYRHLMLRMAAGIYHQPPFYRELRDLDGQLNTDVKAQRSIHLVAGGDFQFLALGREFKLVSEFYYKKLDNLIPYKVENLRIRYFASNHSKGYAAGADFRLNGEFVPGTESWMSLSILQTREDIQNDFYYDYYNSNGEKIIPGYTFNNVAVDSIRVEPGYIPRPTDQRVTFSMFFQDYIPKFPTWKVHLNLVYGTGLPFGPPGREKYKDILRIPDYRRVDIGFSKIFIDEENPRVSRLKWVNRLKAFWVSLEVFNLLQVNNTVSYLWIADITNRYYAVPNYLSARTVNLRLNVKF